MILISHRGNTIGRNSEKENHPDTILETLKLGYHCEVDVWRVDDHWYLGHDAPQHKVDFDFIFHSSRLWVHAKNNLALFELLKYPEINVFWHETDKYTLTSHGFVWCYPGSKSIKNYNTISVLPESVGQDVSDFHGICSDFIISYDKSNSI